MDEILRDTLRKEFDEVSLRLEEIAKKYSVSSDVLFSLTLGFAEESDDESVESWVMSHSNNCKDEIELARFYGVQLMVLFPEDEGPLGIPLPLN